MDKDKPEITRCINLGSQDQSGFSSLSDETCSRSLHMKLAVDGMLNINTYKQHRCQGKTNQTDKCECGTFLKQIFKSL